MGSADSTLAAETLGKAISNVKAYSALQLADDLRVQAVYNPCEWDSSVAPAIASRLSSTSGCGSPREGSPLKQSQTLKGVSSDALQDVPLHRLLGHSTTSAIRQLLLTPAVECQGTTLRWRPSWEGFAMGNSGVRSGETSRSSLEFVLILPPKRTTLVRDSSKRGGGLTLCLSDQVDTAYEIWFLPSHFLPSEKGLSMKRLGQTAVELYQCTECHQGAMDSKSNDYIAMSELYKTVLEGSTKKKKSDPVPTYFHNTRPTICTQCLDRDRQDRDSASESGSHQGMTSSSSASFAAPTPKGSSSSSQSASTLSTLARKPSGLSPMIYDVKRANEVFGDEVHRSPFEKTTVSTVLLVEPDKGAARVVKKALTSGGILVIPFDGPAACLKYLETNRSVVHGVVCSFVLPKMSAVDFVARINPGGDGSARSSFKTIPVVAVGAAHFGACALAGGCRGFLSVPLQPAEVLRTVRGIV